VTNRDPTYGSNFAGAVQMQRDPNAPKSLADIKEEFWKSNRPKEYGDAEGNPNMRENP